MRCVLLCLLEVPEMMRCVLLYLLEVSEAPEMLGDDARVLLCMLEVMRCVRSLCVLEAMKGGLVFDGVGGDALRATLYAGDVGSAASTEDDALCALCMLEAVEGELCLLGVLKVMYCVLLRILEAVEGGSGGAGRAGRARSDVLYATLFAVGVEGAKAAGCAGGDALRATLYAVDVGCAGSTAGDALCALCMLEAVENELCSLEVSEVMRCVRRCML